MADTKNDVAALKEAGYDTSDVGRGNKAMTSSDVGKMTGTSSSHAAGAAHAARDDARASGEIPGKKS